MRISDDMLRQSAEQARERWLDTLPRRDELPRTEVSEQFRRRMERLLRRADRAEARKSFMRTAGKIAAVLLLFTTVFFTMLMSVNADFREKVLTTIKQVLLEYTEYDYFGSQEEVSLPRLDLSALPDGFTVLSDEQLDRSSRLIHCENSAGIEMDIYLVAITQYSTLNMIVDTEDAEVTEFERNGREITVVTKKGINILLWEEGAVVISVSSRLTVPELLKLIDDFLLMS